MGELNNDLTWPPTPIFTDRLTLRSTRASDRASFIDLQCSSAVRQYLGGPLDREQIEEKAPAVPGNYPGMFAVADASGFVGMALFDRRDQHQSGHIRPEGNELEVSYMLHERVWARDTGQRRSPPPSRGPALHCPIQTSSCAPSSPTAARAG